jgi:hypothetical protein
VKHGERKLLPNNCSHRHKCKVSECSYLCEEVKKLKNRFSKLYAVSILEKRKILHRRTSELQEAAEKDSICCINGTKKEICL